MKSGSNLEKVFAKGEFAITGELGPPKGSNVEEVKKKAGMLKGFVDAVNITDNQTAVVRMSSIAASTICLQEGLEPVMQMVCRDRNRIGIQSDILGAAAFGLKNILCLSGDHQSFGNQGGGKNVFDIDSIQLISTVKRMRDDKKLLNSEDELEGGAPMFIGAAANPFAEPFDYRPYRLKKKVEAGVDFVQTQCIYDMEMFKEYMKKVVDMGLHEKCKIMAGITPLKSAGMTKYMANRVPGIIIPQEVIDRMSGVPKEEAAEEGIKICIEQMHQMKEIQGVAGIHLMAIEWEHRSGEIIERAGFLPRPVFDN
jgi:methylenetetrahydrofolate reductase (NADPH)